MKNKQLSKYVVYVPKKNLTIQKVNRPFDNWRLLLIPVLFILLVLSSSLGNSFYFPMLFGFVISIVVTIKNTNIIKKDIEEFVDLLKTKAVLQHIQFDIEILF